MKKLNTSRPTLPWLVTCFSLVLLIIGPAAAPFSLTTRTLSQAEDPVPPTPAETAYGDWASHSRSSLMEADKDSSPELEQLGPQNDCALSPSKENYTGVVYSTVSTTDYNEDITFRQGACQFSIHKRLTTDPGEDFEPRLNRNASYVVFTSNRTGNMEVYTMTSSGTQQVRRTNHPAVDRMPAFSADGTKIVFVSDRTGNPEIFVMNADGSNPRPLTNSPEVDVEPDWSPDGKSIAWVRRFANGTGALYVMNADGTNQRSLTAPMPFAGTPVWSPNSTRLALQLDLNDDGWYELGLINANGSGLSLLNIPKTETTQDFEMGGWTPDGNSLVIARTTYIFYENTWYITSSYVERVYLSSVSNPQPFVYGFQFKPHVRSMDDIAPASSLSPLPEWSPAGDIVLRWQVQDNLSGVHFVTIDSRAESSPAWTTIFGTAYWERDQRSVSSQWTYQASPGQTLYFRSSASDHAANSEVIKVNPEAWTRVYALKGAVHVDDARGQPLAGVAVNLNPGAMNQVVTGLDGSSVIYYPKADYYNPYSVTINKPGYAALPAQSWQVYKKGDFQAVLPGADERLTNGQFEDNAGPLTGWQSSGGVAAGSGAGRISGTSARLGSLCPDVLCLGTAKELSGAQVSQMAVGPDGRIYILYNQNRAAILKEDGSLQPLPSFPGTVHFYTRLKFDQNGTPYLIGSSPFGLYRLGMDQWVYESIPNTMNTFYYDMDAQGRIYMVVPTSTGLQYTQRSVSGQWTTPKPANLQWTSGGNQVDLYVEPGGTLHVAVVSPGPDGKIQYLRFLPDGRQVDSLVLQDFPYVNSVHLRYLNNQGIVLIVSQTMNTSEENWQALLRSPAGKWSKLGVDLSQGTVLDVETDHSGNLYVMSGFVMSQADGQRMVYAIKAAGDHQFHSTTLPKHVYPLRDSAIDAQGNHHFITYRTLGPTQWAYEYWHGSPASSYDKSILSQSIALPAAMVGPTLSFYYRIESPNPLPQSRFQVIFTPGDGQEQVLLDHPANATGWTHTWVDLSPALGQPGTLSFAVQQAPGDYPPAVWIDEVSLASYPLPIALKDLRPRYLQSPNEGETWMDMLGDNFVSGVQVFIKGSPAPAVEWISSGRLRVRLPDNLPAGPYTVRVVNPGGAEASDHFLVGHFTFTPAIRR